MNRGIYRTVSTVLTQVIVDPYDEAFYTPTKVLGRYMSAEEANEERKKGNYVIEEAGKGFRRVVSAPHPVKIVELDAVNALLDADQVVIAAGGGGIPVLEQDNHLKGASAVIEKRPDCRKTCRRCRCRSADHPDKCRAGMYQSRKRQRRKTGRNLSCTGKRIYGAGTFRSLQHAPEIQCFRKLCRRQRRQKCTHHFLR